MGLKGFLYTSAPGYNAVLNLESDMNHRYSNEVEVYWPEEKRQDSGAILQAQRAAAIQRAQAFQLDQMYQAAQQSQLSQQQYQTWSGDLSQQQMTLTGQYLSQADEVVSLKQQLAHVRAELAGERSKPKMQIKVEAAEDVTLRLRKELETERQKNMKLADELGRHQASTKSLIHVGQRGATMRMDLESENRGLRAKVQQLKDQIIKLGARPY